MPTIFAGTGHRPQKLGGFSPQALTRIYNTACYALRHNHPDYLISGMALGWDQMLAFAAIRIGIPFTAAIPFPGQESNWPKNSQQFYHWLLQHAAKVHYVCEPGYASWKMQKRNEWMVDQASHILTLWDGSSGGTANCIEYAKTQNKILVPCWDLFLSF